MSKLDPGGSLKKKKFYWTETAIIVGAAITSVGVGLIHFAAGVIAAGVLMLAGGVISAIFGGDGQ